MDLPQGFVLDQPKDRAALPQGFVIDEPKKGLRGDLAKRAEQFRFAGQEADALRQTQIEANIQRMGAIAGGVGDVAGAGLAAAGRGIAAITPEPIANAVSGLATDAIQSPVGQTVLGGIGKAMDAYEGFAQENPRAARNIESIANIGLIGAPALGRSKQIGAAAKDVGIAAAKKLKPVERMSSKELRDIGGKLFKEAEAQNAILMPQVNEKFFNEVNNILPQTAAGRATIGESEVSRLLNRWEQAGIKDQPLTFTAAKEMDEALGNMAYSMRNPDGTFTNDGRLLLDAQRKLRDTIENAAETDFVGGKDAFRIAKEARNYWSTSIRLRDIERILENADTFQVPATAIKTGFRQILRNDKKLSGYSAAEQAAIRKAAETGIVTDILNIMGSRLGTITGAGVGGATMGPAGAVLGGVATYAGGALSRKAATASQIKKARFVEDLIRQRVTGKTAQQPLTPEVLRLAKELGITAIPAGGADVLLQQLQEIQNTGTVPEIEE